MNNDLISRSVLLEKVSRMIDYCKTDKKVNGLTALFQAGDAIMDCPAVNALPVDIVAQMLCDAIGDPCACNINGNDEWLSMVCDLQIECPYPKDGLGCWKQYIKHYGERRDDE